MIDKPAAEGAASTSRPLERRQHPRAQADWAVTLHLEGGLRRARLRDVSRAGICFFLDCAVPEMTLLEIDLEWPGPSGNRRLSGRGAVVRCERIAEGVEHWEIAVFLHEMDEGDRRSLDEYVGRSKGSEA